MAETSFERVVFRYFECRGRVQAIREALVDAGVPFMDERVVIGPNWRATMKEAPTGGPFGSLPVLEWGSDIVAQTLPIAGYVARRLGQYDGLDAMGIARLEMIASSAYLDVIFEVTMMIWGALSTPEAEAAERFATHEARIAHKIDRFERILADGSAPLFGGERPALADFFVAESIGMARAALPARIEGHLQRAPRMVEMISALAHRPAVLRYVAEGKRPTRLCGAPNEPESLHRIHRWDAGGGA
jgi:glutathione S-transferase